MMKTLDDYMKLPYKLEIVPDSEEGGYVGSYPELRGCMTTGETIAARAANAEDAKREWLLAAMEEGLPIPEPPGRTSKPPAGLSPGILRRDPVLPYGLPDWPSPWYGRLFP